MKPTYHHLTARLCRLLLCLAALLTVACQDDYIEKNAGLTGDSDKTTLRLIVPMTRATGDETSDATDSEATVKSLWLLAYPVVEDEGETLVKQLRTDNLPTNGTYNTYSVDIKLGKYRMYVVANVPEINTNMSETQLNDLLLKYKDDANNILLPNLNAGLPMVCEYQDIKLTESGDRVGEAGVEIKFNETTTVYADLTFVCVKVRYTLVFDNKGVSSAFNESSAENLYINNIVRIDGIQAVKIPGEAPLLIHPNGKSEKDLITTDGTATGTPVSYSLPFGEYHINENPNIIFNKDYTAYDGLDYSQDETSYRSFHASSYAYRGTLYLPEHYVTKSTQANQTELHISATLLSQSEAGGSYVERATLKYTIELGDTQDQDDQTNKADKVRQLPRGRYYDITACITSAGDELEITAAVQDWKLSQVTAELNGPYFLQVEKTQIGVKAGEATIVNCSTDAPILGYESPTYNDIPIYKVDFHKEGEEYTSFTVTVNPEMPAVEDAANNTAIGKYIYIIANNLKKKIEISPLELDPYLIVTPASYTIYMKEIANLQSYSVQFTYETNLENIRITCDEAESHSHITYEGLHEQPTSVINGRGTLVCTLNEPYDQTKFSSNEEITFTYTATSSTHVLTEHTTLKIIPNATTYRLYFKATNQDWSNVHIYVYEPLYTPSESNYVNTPILITGTNADDLWIGENALLYSFTGKRTFLGWEKHGGDIEFSDANRRTDSPNDNDFYWDGENNSLHDATSEAYNTIIDYCETFRNEVDCNSCKNENYNHKWPGIRMKPSDDGWYYYDLPLIAEPGKALIMFANAHGGDLDYKNRYPAHMVPGIPLYNFADKEGWFYYNPENDDENEFVDDKPTTPPAIKYYTLRFKGLNKYITLQDDIYLHFFKYDTPDKPYTTWPGIKNYNFNTSEEYVDISVTAHQKNLFMNKDTRVIANHNKENETKGLFMKWNIDNGIYEAEVSETEFKYTLQIRLTQEFMKNFVFSPINAHIYDPITNKGSTWPGYLITSISEEADGSKTISISVTEEERSNIITKETWIIVNNGHSSSDNTNQYPIKDGWILRKESWQSIDEETYINEAIENP